ncbi:hypothetical protein JCM11641_003363 [Rhodosporidiobolus odoratus]
MRPSGVLPLLSTLLFVLCVCATQPDGAVDVSVAVPSSYGLATRFLETVHHQKPSVFYEYTKLLTDYRFRPKTTWSNPLFKPKSKGLDGKARPGPYANHNPIFTRHALANESFNALESTLFRSQLFRGRAEINLVRLALAGGVADSALDAMHRVWVEREAELEASGAAKPKRDCESWIDVAERKVCAFDEFWKAVGAEQVIKRGRMSIPGETPKTYPFDRFLPLIRNESLPFVVLYAASSDEAFPRLFEALHALAQPKAGKPRLQFALRWKPDTQAGPEYYAPEFSAEVTIQSGIELSEVADVADFSSRAIAYIQQSQAPREKLAALAKVSSSLPLVAAQIAMTSPVAATIAPTGIAEQVTINGIPLDLSDLSSRNLVALLDRERQVLSDIASASSNFYEENAKDIVLNANVSFEVPRDSAVSLAVPTEDKPLKFVNLARAFKDLSGRFMRGSFVEGVAESTGSMDPPAVASFHVVADLDSEHGRKLVKNSLKFLENNGEVRVSYVHNPSSTAKAPHRFAYSTLVAKLVEAGDFADVYPNELLAFLAFNASPDSSPKRSLDDEWTAENPMTPFVDSGATEEDEMKAEVYWRNAATFVERIGLKPGDSAVLLNGRLINLDSHDFATGSFAALHQYELKRRIRPIVAATLPVLPKAVLADRRLQADVVAISSSVIGAAGIARRLPLRDDLKSLHTFAVGDPSRSMFSLTATLDPLSPTARAVVPILHSLSSLPLAQTRIYLLPSTLSQLDLTTLSGRSFPITPLFSEEDESEAKPFVRLGQGLPIGAGVVLDVKAFLPSGEVLSGPGGEGGETVKLEPGQEGERVIKEVVFTKVKVPGVGGAEVQKLGEHVRDEL